LVLPSALSCLTSHHAIVAFIPVTHELSARHLRSHNTRTRHSPHHRVLLPRVLRLPLSATRGLVRPRGAPRQLHGSMRRFLVRVASNHHPGLHRLHQGMATRCHRHLRGGRGQSDLPVDM
ncbi:hypothetical protein BDZ90DRAFT_180583, partial [Jaminaea rosea]